MNTLIAFSLFGWPDMRAMIFLVFVIALGLLISLIFGD